MARNGHARTNDFCSLVSVAEVAGARSSRRDWTRREGRAPYSITSSLATSSVCGTVRRARWRSEIDPREFSPNLQPIIFTSRTRRHWRRRLPPSAPISSAWPPGRSARPFSANYGDRIGRKAPLIATLLCMGLATFLIAFVPTYASLHPIVVRRSGRLDHRRSLSARQDWLSYSYVAVISRLVHLGPNVQHYVLRLLAGRKPTIIGNLGNGRGNMFRNLPNSRERRIQAALG